MKKGLIRIWLVRESESFMFDLAHVGEPKLMNLAVESISLLLRHANSLDFYELENNFIAGIWNFRRKRPLEVGRAKFFWIVCLRVLHIMTFLEEGLRALGMYHKLAQTLMIVLAVKYRGVKNSSVAH